MPLYVTWPCTEDATSIRRVLDYATCDFSAPPGLFLPIGSGGALPYSSCQTVTVATMAGRKSTSSVNLTTGIPLTWRKPRRIARQASSPQLASPCTVLVLKAGPKGTMLSRQSPLSTVSYSPLRAPHSRRFPKKGFCRVGTVRSADDLCGFLSRGVVCMAQLTPAEIAPCLLRCLRALRV